ncbi:MAG: methyl-accepting chemotaxis protein [Lachnospiraceae bacterium]|nr:methyl-accepting chemotaxis protein [Lachnospiraceae bacterium]
MGKRKKSENRKVSKKGLMKQLLRISLIPLLVTSIASVFISSVQMSNEIRDETYAKMSAVAFMAEKMYEEIDSGDYVFENGEMKKGDYRITNNTTLVDSIKERTDVDITVYYQDTSELTTIFDKNSNRATDIKVSDKVAKTVLKEGKEYHDTETIGGKKYYSYYLPILSGDGEVIGTLAASEEQGVVTEALKKTFVYVFSGIGIVFIVSVFAVISSANKLSAKIQSISVFLGNIRNGDLTTSLNAKAIKDKTEIGDIAESALKLNVALGEMVDNIKKTTVKLSNSAEMMQQTADTTNTTTQEVNKAIEEITTGTVSQAEETQNATDAVISMGEEIEKTSETVKILMVNSDVMSQSGESANRMIHELSKANHKTMDAVDRIYRHTELTNEAVQKISNAARIITSIAEETNLLALNASIEAARAGENGKGFAVVASEIQELAEQSNGSADEIMKEIENLMAESEKSVEVMRDVRMNVDLQSEKLSDTKDNFNTVIDGIRKSVENIHEIETIIFDLNENRKTIIDIIQSLSAISEENAAASEETAASTIQLGEVIDKLAEDASELNTLAELLEKEVSAFKTN